MDPYSQVPDMGMEQLKCKACNMVLEEGKAYELAGHRWHIDCFQCCKCQQSLNTQANLLLLGDGSLICNDCTFTCEVCKTKIENLAILTSDLAFCESCFRCRNCEKEIENLRYARTSQGIFCMECHTAQAASRRRRKFRQQQQQQHQQAGAQAKNMSKYKSLPALPSDSPSGADHAGALHDPAHNRLGKEAEELSQAMQSLALPDNAHGNHGQRPSTFESSLNGSEEGMYIPVTLDHSTVGPTFSPDIPHLPQTTFEQRPPASRFSSGSDMSDVPRSQLVSATMSPDMMSSSQVLSGNLSPQASALPSVSTPPIASASGGRQWTPRMSVNSASGSASNDRPSFPSNNYGSYSDTAQPAASAAATASLEGGQESKSQGSTRAVSASLAQPSSEGTPSAVVPMRENLPARGDSLNAAPKADLARSKSVGSKKVDEGDKRSAHAATTATTKPHPVRSSSRNDSQPKPFKSGSSSSPQAGPSQEFFSQSPILPSQWLSSQSGDALSPSLSIANTPQIQKGDDASIELSSQLEKSNKRIAELEAENRRLTTLVEKGTSLKNADSVLEEKRSTMAALDSHRELILSELRAMKVEFKRHKSSEAPVDIDDLKSDVLSRFMSEMESVRNEFKSEMEDMVKRRADLEAEISNLIQMKDKGFQEYEALTTRNNQLLNLNAHLTNMINSRQTRASDNRAGAGLGLEGSWQVSQAEGVVPPSGTVEMYDGELSVVESPQLVEIRKAKPKTKVWGRQIARGLKGALGIEKQAHHQMLAGVTEPGVPYNQLPQGDSPANGAVVAARSTTEKSGGFGSLFASTNKGGRKGLGGYNPKGASSSTNVGSSMYTDLQALYEHEGNNIPRIITACIEEVDSRGLSSQGIYRLSGSKNEVDELKEGLESKTVQTMEGVDIHVVSSALKQYFRKLENPLITFDVYDPLLEAAQIPDAAIRAHEMRAALEGLPEGHFVTVKYLLSHLKRVVSSAKDNLMNVNNVAIVFAPTIMRTEDLAREHSDLEIRGHTMQYLIELYDTIFPPDELSPPTSQPVGTSSVYESIGPSSSGSYPPVQTQAQATQTQTHTQQTQTQTQTQYSWDDGSRTGTM